MADASAPRLPGERPRALRRRWKLLAALALALALVASVLVRACLVGPEVEVLTPARRSLVQTVVTTGRVAPPFEIRLAALELGRVTRVHVDEGDRVQAGQLLIELDDSEARALVDQAAAEVARARARTRNVRKLSAPTATESLLQAQARLDEAERDLARAEELYAAGTISAAELEATRTRRDLTRSQTRAAELDAAAVSSRGAQYQVALAERALVEAGLAAAQARLARLRITAPADGTVIRRSVESGETVSPGAELLVLARAGKTQLVVEPDETNLPLLAVGQPALASAEAFPERTFAAEVAFIAPAIDRLRGTIEVKLDVPEAPAYLRTDMTVSVEIEVGRRARALVVPASAVRDLATDEPWVLVVDGGVTARRDVTIGLRGDGLVELVDGVDENTRIVASAGSGPDLGRRVRARAAPAGAEPAARRATTAPQARTGQAAP